MIYRMTKFKIEFSIYDFLCLIQKTFKEVYTIKYIHMDMKYLDKDIY